MRRTALAKLAALTDESNRVSADSCVLTLYRFEAAPVEFRELFGPHAAGWLAHVSRSIDSIESLLASWRMEYRVKERRVLPDGSLALAGDFDLFASGSELRYSAAHEALNAS